MAKKSEEVVETVEEVKEVKEEKVSITMLQEPGSSALTRIVAVNDLIYRVPYGEPVKVEPCIAEVIKEYNARIRGLAKEKAEKKKKVDLVQL